MQFMILIAGDEKVADALSKEEGHQVFELYMKYTEDLKKAGVLLAGEALTRSSSGTRISAPNGKRTVVDGPFAEAKEVIGGYYLVQAKSKDEAVEWASRCPAVTYGGYVEVREVMVFPR